VAIHAAHVALCDFVEEALPVLTSSERADCLQLVDPVSMIELKHHRIGLTAVDAGVALEKVEQKSRETVAAAPIVPPRLLQVLGDVAAVVLFGIRALAGPAKRRTTPRLSVLQRELC
jgi:hypothetical protein